MTVNKNMELIKYPRTPHLSGSRLQPGDEDLSQIPFSDIQGKHLVVEEKCDGANSAISFGPAGELRLQSRGHYLTGGYRERHYDLLKQWASVHREAFYQVLGSRYVMLFSGIRYSGPGKRCLSGYSVQKKADLSDAGGISTGASGGRIFRSEGTSVSAGSFSLYPSRAHGASEELV